MFADCTRDSFCPLPMIPLAISKAVTSYPLRMLPFEHVGKLTHPDGQFVWRHSKAHVYIGNVPSCNANEQLKTTADLLIPLAPDASSAVPLNKMTEARHPLSNASPATPLARRKCAGVGSRALDRRRRGEATPH